MPLDLPPTPEPATIEIQKMDQKQNLIQKIKEGCEASVKSLKESDTEGGCILSARAYFLDICNAANADEIFSYKIASFLGLDCQDNFVPQVTGNYYLTDNFHIKSEDIIDLKHILQDEGKGDFTFERISPVSKSYPFALSIVYTIIYRDPNFNPQFTTFSFGGTLADMPPLRDKDGNPNMEFFRAWKQKTEDYYYIIMELCDNDLSNELKKRRKGFSAKEIKSIMSQLNNAFKKMDENKIIHRDLKIENILIKYKDETKKDFIPKLCDYGFSKILKENDLTFTGLGTASTKAPEIWEGEPYNSKVDLWSVGVIIYQLHFKDLPYKGNNENELYKQIKENVPYKKSEDLILRDLLDHLLVKDPSKRYSWEDYFNHPFFKEEKTKK